MDMRQIQVGDKVSHLDSSINGVVLAISEFRATVLLEDGFEEEFLVSKLVHQNIDISIDIEPKEVLTHMTFRKEKTHEVDLHLEALTVHWKSIIPENALNYQIASFLEELHYAAKNRYDKFIVIHGKGTGKLKEHLINLIKEKRLNYIEMMDGKYRNSALCIHLSSESDP